MTFLHYYMRCADFICNFFLNTGNLLQNDLPNNLISTIIDLGCSAGLLNMKEVHRASEYFY